MNITITISRCRYILGANNKSDYIIINIDNMKRWGCFGADAFACTVLLWCF